MIKQYRAIIFLLSVNSFSYCQSLYYSQFGQDQYVAETLFKHKRKGVFFDIGAHDGVTGSNTYYFEKELGWTGICVEPIDEIFKSLAQNRSCVCLHGGIFDTEGQATFIHIHGPSEVLSGLAETYDPRHLKRAQSDIWYCGGSIEKSTIQTFRFNDICAHYGITHIDFLSIDTEGSEERIIRSIDFDAVDISVITVENNFKEDAIQKYLEDKDYIFLCRLTVDDIYIKKEMLSSLNS